MVDKTRDKASEVAEKASDVVEAVVSNAAAALTFVSRSDRGASYTGGADSSDDEEWVQSDKPGQEKSAYSGAENGNGSHSNGSGQAKDSEAKDSDADRLQGSRK